MNAWRIRRVAGMEVPSVASLFDEYRRMCGYPSERSAVLTYIRECVAGGEVIALTACDASRPLDLLGFTLLYPSFSSMRLRRTWHIQDMYVVPRARRRGIGRMLMEHAVKFARQNGSEHITLLSPEENEAFSSLSTSLGFERYVYDPEYRRYRLKLTD
jgi:ribosomal protein S18 acetylase RimI-like enzyme